MHVPQAPDLSISPFGADVVYCVRTAAQPLDYELHPAEAELLTPRAVDKRRLEFRLGRAAAHHALRALLGTTPGPVGRGASREPLWPPDTVGAITHTADTAAAAVAHERHHAGIGLDLEERSRHLGDELVPHICTESETRWVGTDDDAALRLMLLFSAKESVFKLFYPREQVFLGFHDAELRWRDDAQAFDARLRTAAGAAYPAGTTVRVGCRVNDAHVMTWAALPGK